MSCERLSRRCPTEQWILSLSFKLKIKKVQVENMSVPPAKLFMSAVKVATYSESLGAHMALIGSVIAPRSLPGKDFPAIE